MLITWNEFAWAAFLYGSIGGDRDYQALMQQTQFLNDLRTNPTHLQTEQIQEQLIERFLNRWKCRVWNRPETARAIVRTLERLRFHLDALKDLEITTVGFDEAIAVDNDSTRVSEIIEHCYNTVASIGFNFGPTASSKLLHILQPGLFVMWDKDIVERFKGKNENVSNSGKGYRAFLELMQQTGKEVSRSFYASDLNPLPKPDDDPVRYLSVQLGYDPPKTMAKYLDEYNWVTITNMVRVPPAWHP